MSGRPSEPAKVHLLRGTARPDRSAPKTPPLATSEVPPGLTGAARAKWLELAPTLDRAGALTVVVREQLFMACDAWREYRAADRALRRGGGLTYTTTTPQGSEMIRPRAEVAIRESAWKRYMAGMAALKQAFAHATPKPERKSGLDELLG